MTQCSWNMCWQGVTLTCVEASKSSTQIAQLSYFSLILTFEYFIFLSCFDMSVSLYFLYCSMILWAATGSCTRFSIVSASSIEFAVLALYLQKRQKDVQQHRAPKARTIRTTSMKTSMSFDSVLGQRNSIFF